MRTPTIKELHAIERLLVASGLPTDDLSEQDLSLFRIEGSGDDLTAVGGLERLGNTALVRSIATSEAMRGRGIAGEIVKALEELAAKEGFENLYLLTETAEHYFESRGYSPVRRSDVPESIRGSRQFSSLCPDSAIVMHKRVSA